MSVNPFLITPNGNCRTGCPGSVSGWPPGFGEIVSGPSSAGPEKRHSTSPTKSHGEDAFYERAKAYGAHGANMSNSERQ
ncbi:hypothetical protein ZHAS_00016208 [Anopheles sinensis]|uniref:Uncharacterized protein n=1 Tax=Anopheles sinensis TaxID=74873 RepID=A0A084WD50_ANOSI|nr:hypothetical protein ZHAS_00016208 [Anopheles sinensis]